MGDAGPGQCPGGGSLSAELEPCPVLRPASRHCPHPPPTVAGAVWGDGGHPGASRGFWSGTLLPLALLLVFLSVSLSRAWGVPFGTNFPVSPSKGWAWREWGAQLRRACPASTGWSETPSHAGHWDPRAEQNCLFTLNTLLRGRKGRGDRSVGAGPGMVEGSRRL